MRMSTKLEARVARVARVLATVVKTADEDVLVQEQGYRDQQKAMNKQVDRAVTALDTAATLYDALNKAYGNVVFIANYYAAIRDIDVALGVVAKSVHASTYSRMRVKYTQPKTTPEPFTGTVLNAAAAKRAKKRARETLTDAQAVMGGGATPQIAALAEQLHKAVSVVVRALA